MPVTICKQCKRTGSDPQGAFFAGWIKAIFQGRGIDKEFWLCDKCTTESVNIKFNVREE